MVTTEERIAYRHIRKNGPPRLLVIDFCLFRYGVEITQRSKSNFILRCDLYSGDENNDIWQKVHTAGGHGFVLKKRTS